MTGKLIALNMKALFARMFLRNSNQKKRNPAIIALFILLAIYVIGAMMFTSGSIFHQLNKLIFSADLGWFYFSFMGLGIFALVSSPASSQPSRNYSVPRITSSCSLFHKAASHPHRKAGFPSAVGIPVAAILALPAFVIWVIYQPVTAVGIVFFFIVVLTLPLAALALASPFCLLLALTDLENAQQERADAHFFTAFMGLYFCYFKYHQPHEIADCKRTAYRVGRPGIPFSDIPSGCRY
jgi:hypothetical protein